MMKNLPALVPVLALCAVLAGCATNLESKKALPAERYQCENDIAFIVRFADDSAAIDSNRGYDVLYRPAGGLSPNQTVFSNRRMRAEFGLGSNGRTAVLSYYLQPLAVRCVRYQDLDAAK